MDPRPRFTRDRGRAGAGAGPGQRLTPPSDLRRAASPDTVRRALASPEHLDVLIVGAGLSGIGAGCHLQTKCPGKRYAILEARDAIGGTWDLFRYPGIRSDSDMYTLGYSFRPWTRGQGDRRRRRRSSSYMRDTAARVRHRREDPLRPPRGARRVVDAPTRAGRSRSSAATSGETVTLDLRLPVHVQRLLPLRRGLHAASSPGTERFRRRASCTRSTGPRTSTTPASASS